VYMVYDRTSCRTGRALRKSLGLPGGLPPHFERHPEVDFLIRWGSSQGRDAAVTLNKATSVALAANKYAALEAMQREGVRTVPFSRNPATLEGTVFGRSQWHAGGTDIVVADADNAYGHHHYTQFIPSEYEMRLHICDEELVRAQVKKGVAEGDIPIRNHARGYHFTPFVGRRPNKERVDTAAAAVKSLGLDFGAVDLLVGVDGRSHVLEVNTSAGCCRPTGLLWAGALLSAARERGVDLRLDERHLGVLSPNE